MKEIPLYQVDAFTNTIFSGNPAAVCPLETWLSDATMQSIAFENNLSETVFFVQNGDHFDIRWFTPTIEVDLCGHATLAASHVIFNHLHHASSTIHFKGQSGDLFIRKTPEGIVMDFPLWPYEPTAPDHALNAALGKTPLQLFKGPDYMALFENEADVKALDPNFSALGKLTYMRGIICTAPASKPDIDFVSRWFGPQSGVFEDPVTGSAHCLLTPFWAERLGKTKFNARQISQRGGDLVCELKGDRVEITGQAALYMKGTIYL